MIVKGMVYFKSKTMQFPRPHDVSNPYDFFLILWNTKNVVLKSVVSHCSWFWF